MKPKRIQRRRSGTLGAIASLLIASAVIRVSASGNLAFAESSPQEPEIALNEMERTKAEAIGNGALVLAIQDREERVSIREQQVSDRALALEFAEAAINEQLAALIAAEEQLRSTIALAEVAADNDLQVLTQVYENMKPKDASALFEEMSPEFAAGFLGLMRAEAAAQIMTGLEPGTAYTISVILAGRNANVPRE